MRLFNLKYLRVEITATKYTESATTCRTLVERSKLGGGGEGGRRRFPLTVDCKNKAVLTADG